MPAQINLGKVRPVDRGEWNEEGTYTILDIVTSNYGSYMSKVGDTETPNTEPLTDRASWIPLADVFALDAAIQEANNSITQLADEVSELELKDVVQSDKIKDIENVLSTANLGQSAQLSVSGRKVVSLPKNASNGGMQVKLEGLTAENLVTNGDFRNGLTGWIFTQGVINNVLVGDVLSFTATAAGNYAGVYVSVVIGRKYYIQTTFKSTSNQVLFSLAGVSQIAHSGGGGFETKSTILSWASPTGNYVIRVQDLRTSGWDEIQIKGGNSGLICIDLTAIFGAGNEPTKEQCDLIFSDHFEGRKNFVPTGRVRSVGKNLFNAGKVKQQTLVQSNGTALHDLGAFTTEFIHVKAGVNYQVIGLTNTTIQRYCLYDKSKNLVKYNFSVYTTFTPTVDGYFRGSYHNANDLYAIQIQSSTVSTYEPYKETSLYLTAPELRSNGTVKDEIRKGANGYELVKRVGVGSINTATEKNGDVTFDNATYWEGKRGANTTITGGEAVFNGSGSYIYLTTLTIGKWYKASVRVNRWTSGLALSFGSTPTGSGTIYREIQRVTGETTTVYFKAVIESIGVGSRSFVVDGAIDNFTCMELGWADDAIGTPSFLQLSDGTILYTLATPVITPISYGGILNSAESGTVYHEPVIADAGVYGSNLPILNTDYPIASIEEIIKHEGGVDTYLNASTAVIAPDGLSFTHPDLGSGDLVLFTYAFDKESTNGNITATFYDSNVVKIDTVTGKAYKITDVVTNGVLTRTLTEV